MAALRCHRMPSALARGASLLALVAFTANAHALETDAQLATIAEDSVAAGQLYTEADIVTPPFSAVNQLYGYGVPDDDFEFTAAYDNPVLITGEAGGFDVFNAVDPGENLPGNGLVTSFDAGSFWQRVTNNQPEYVAARYILGDHNKAFFLGNRSGTIDQDFAYIVHLVPEAYDFSEIILHGGASDYRFITIQQSGRDSSGTAIFYNKGNTYDMVGFLVDITNPSTLPASLFRYTNDFDPPSASPAFANGTDQFGGPNATIISALAMDDAGNTYAGGYSRDPLPGAQGNGRLFVSKYAPDGSKLWTRAFGSGETVDNQDYLFDLVLANGKVYGSGRYYFPGINRNKEMFVVQIDQSTGALNQEAVYNGLSVQFAGSIAADDNPNGFVYIAGIWADIGMGSGNGGGINSARPDPFLLKLPKNSLQVPNVADLINTEISDGLRELWGGLVYSNGVLYATGWTQGNADPDDDTGFGGREQGRDAWLAAINADTLEEVWIEQFGANLQDWAWDVDADAQGNLYVCGHTYGRIKEAATDEHAGLNDGFVIKMEPTNGQIQWVRQFGTSASDSARNISVVGNHVYVCGHTYGSLAGVNQGESDAWIAKLGLNGNTIAIAQFGTDADDRAFLDAGDSGVALGGFTQGSMVAANAGWLDGYLLLLADDLTIDGDGPGPGPGPNDPPQVTLTQPIRTFARTGMTVTAVASATDDEGIAAVGFLINGATEAVDTSAPYRQDFVFDSPGTYTIQAVAEDTDGATAQSNEITVRVFQGR